MDNFSFLKSINKDLYKTIAEAEKLFRDEYFNQVIIQVRKFAENLCRDLLKDKISTEDTFDEIISKLKDNSYENIRMKEFIEDLYFIKKNGNNSAHNISANEEGKIALECLERAFEISVLYSHIKSGFDENLDKTLFSEEILMTQQQTKQPVISDKYVEELEKERNIQKERIIKTLSKTSEKSYKKTSKPKTEKNKISKQPKTVKKSTQITFTEQEKTTSFPAIKVIFIVLLLFTLAIISLAIFR